MKDFLMDFLQPFARCLNSIELKTRERREKEQTDAMSSIKSKNVLPRARNLSNLTQLHHAIQSLSSSSVFFFAHQLKNDRQHMWMKAEARNLIRSKVSE